MRRPAGRPVAAGEEETPAQENLAKSRYYRLIAGAVEGLEHNTLDARRALYERARGALSAWIRSCDPPLARAEVERERRAFEEVVCRVEAEANRRQRLMPARAKRARRPFHRAWTKVARFCSRSGKSSRNRRALVPDRISSSIPAKGDLQLRRRSSAAATGMAVSGAGGQGPPQAPLPSELFSDCPLQPVLDDVHEGSPGVDRGADAVSMGGQLHCRVQAMIQAARYHGIGA
jgi:hypothetical protein